jgi:hypothetical protein
MSEFYKQNQNNLRKLFNARHECLFLNMTEVVKSFANNLLKFDNFVSIFHIIAHTYKSRSELDWRQEEKINNLRM